MPAEPVSCVDCPMLQRCVREVQLIMAFGRMIGKTEEEVAKSIQVTSYGYVSLGEAEFLMRKAEEDAKTKLSQYCI